MSSPEGFLAGLFGTAFLSFHGLATPVRRTRRMPGISSPLIQGWVETEKAVQIGQRYGQVAERLNGLRETQAPHARHK